MPDRASIRARFRENQIAASLEKEAGRGAIVADGNATGTFPRYADAPEPEYNGSMTEP